MPEYTITFARSARRELERLDTRFVVRIFPAIESLAQEARPSGCRKLRGQENLWRIRIGDYRVVYKIDDGASVIDIVAVRHRREAYQ